MLVRLLLAGLAAVPAHAQVVYGSVAGNVNDSSGAAVPFTRDAQTNEAGSSLFPLCPAEPIPFNVAKTGFTTFSAEGAPVPVSATLETLTDPSAPSAATPRSPGSPTPAATARTSACSGSDSG